MKIQILEEANRLIVSFENPDIGTKDLIKGLLGATATNVPSLEPMDFKETAPIINGSEEQQVQSKDKKEPDANKQPVSYAVIKSAGDFKRLYDEYMKDTSSLDAKRFKDAVSSLDAEKNPVNLVKGIIIEYGKAKKKFMVDVKKADETKLRETYKGILDSLKEEFSEQKKLA